MTSKTARLKRMVELANGSNIASIRSVVSGIVRIIDDPVSNAKDLKDIIEIDPPLTARVLRAANSAYYAPVVHIGEVVQAIVRIGFNTLKELALHQKVCEIFEYTESIGTYSNPLLWRHSLAVALLAKMIYRREFAQKGENAYVGGLLHDIGIIVENQFLQADFRTVLDKMASEQINLTDAEQVVLEFNHSDVGMLLLDNWNLPPEYVAGVGYHHRPLQAPEQHRQYAAILHIADCLCQEHNLGYGDSPFPNANLFNQCLKSTGIKRIALNMIVNEVVEEMCKMEDQGLL